MMTGQRTTGHRLQQRSGAAKVSVTAGGILLLTFASTAAQPLAPAPPAQQQLILTPRQAPVPADPAPSPVEPPAQVQTPAQAPVQATPPKRPGLFDALGRWMEDSANAAKSGWDSARTALGGLGGQAGGAAKGAADAASGVAKGAADAASGAAQGVSSVAAGAAKGAADAVTRPLTTRFANGRERCTVAPNGAPDCRAAAEHLCKTAGYGAGSSVDMQSAEKCPARVYLEGRKSPSDCSMEHYVTRAMCQ